MEERVIRGCIVAGIAFALVGLVVFYTLPWTLISVGGTLIGVFSPNPPIPEIKHGEFPFKLVYEMEGVQYSIEDTLICEYKGIVLKESGGGKRIEWKHWLESGDSAIVLLTTLPPANASFLGETLVLREIVYWLGPTEHYMGYDVEYKHMFPDAGCNDYRQSGRISQERISSKDLLRMYRIRLISWEIAPPLINTFR